MVKTGETPLFDDRCVLAHRAKQRAYRVWSWSRSQADWKEYRVARRRAQLVYEDAERVFKERSKSFDECTKSTEVVFTVRIAVFGVSSSSPPLADRGGNLVSSADEKASSISAHYDAKQCRDSFKQPHSCEPSPVLYSVAFRFSFIRNFLLDLDP